MFLSGSGDCLACGAVNPVTPIAVGPETPAVRPVAPDPAMLDCLGRLPIPLRRPLRARLDRVAARHRLKTCLLMGSEWYSPFADLARAGGPAGLPGLILSPWSPDLFDGPLHDQLHGGAFQHPPLPPVHPLVTAAGLADPLGVFAVVAVIPLLFLVDHRRLGDRPPPRRWADLCDRRYAGDIVFGGWRPHAGAPYQDINEFLLLCLHHMLGDSGLDAFAANVRVLVPNIRTARIAGSNSAGAAAVAVMPWLQADISPRRQRVSVIWPDDGALALPIGCFVRADRAERLRPLLDVLTGAELAAVLAANRYPPAIDHAGVTAWPAAAALRWPGWAAMRGAGLADRCRQASRRFFAVCDG